MSSLCTFVWHFLGVSHSRITFSIPGLGPEFEIGIKNYRKEKIKGTPPRLSWRRRHATSGLRHLFDHFVRKVSTKLEIQIYFNINKLNFLIYLSTFCSDVLIYSFMYVRSLNIFNVCLHKSALILESTVPHSMARIEPRPAVSMQLKNVVPRNEFRPPYLGEVGP
jgi:hypothetical protein